VATPWGRGEVETGLVGAFNAANCLGVLGVLLASDVPLAAALDALSHLEPPAGRMQRLGGREGPLVVVDYAHTPDALEKALAALRPAVRAGRELRAVFGCGGDRDKGKRPQMGRIAATLADRVYVTNDNPRSEDPQAIAQAVVQGIRETGNRRYRVELDRAAAIRLALEDAQVGDVVLIAGKGHEPYQETAGCDGHSPISRPRGRRSRPCTTACGYRDRRRRRARTHARAGAHVRARRDGLARARRGRPSSSRWRRALRGPRLRRAGRCRRARPPRWSRASARPRGKAR
jgi:hypothetical protein